MKSLLSFIHALYSFTGFKLYYQIAGMVMVSILEGAGILLLIPMLAAAGILKLDIAMGTSLYRIKNLMPTFTHSQTSIELILLTYVCLVVGQSWLQRHHKIYNMKIQQDFTDYLRVKVYRALLKAKWSYFLSKHRSNFSHILTAELTRVSNGTEFLLQFASSVIFMIIHVVMALFLSFHLTLIILFFGMLFSLFIYKFIKMARAIGKRTSLLTKDFYSSIHEDLQGLKDIKGYGLEVAQLERFQRSSQLLKQNMISYTSVNSQLQLYSKVVMALLISLFIYSAVTIMKVQNHELIIVILLFSRMWPRFFNLQSQIQQIYGMLPSYEHLVNLLDEMEREHDEWILKKQSKTIQLTTGITFSKVDYRYTHLHSVYALKDVEVFIPVNQTTAIVGPSGAGKSTFVDLLMGLIQPERGVIKIDGQQISSEIGPAWRNTIGYVSQDAFLFNGTIRDNLLFVRPQATEAELWRALKMASCQFVSELHDSIDTLIGDRGIKLSGGERQRIVLARALLRKPRVLILDEATSSLDTENERRIQQAIEILQGEMTIIIIAHRLSTIRNADHIIVLDKGKVIQKGDYNTLANDKSGLFSRLIGRFEEAVV